MQWVLALPYALFSVLGVVESVENLSNYRLAAPLEQATQPFDLALRLTAYTLIGSFFAAMGIKYGITQSPDAKRRLRILYWGSTAAWTPGLVLVFAGLITHKPASSLLPQWLIVALLAPLLLFPLTLAYVIVVEKAMDVSVVLRQGLQYVLARTGTRVIQALMVGVVIFAGLRLAVIQ